MNKKLLVAVGIMLFAYPVKSLSSIFFFDTLSHPLASDFVWSDLSSFVHVATIWLSIVFGILILNYAGAPNSFLGGWKKKLFATAFIFLLLPVLYFSILLKIYSDMKTCKEEAKKEGGISFCNPM